MEKENNIYKNVNSESKDEWEDLCEKCERVRRMILYLNEKGYLKNEKEFSKFLKEAKESK